MQIHLTNIHLPSLSQSSDVFIWLVDGDAFTSYSTSRTREALRNRDVTVPWAESIWFKSATPRHAFLMWIAQYDRMPTRARLLSWGLGNSANCCLCDSAIESRDHLLLRCEVSKQIWTLILRGLGYNHSGFHTWTALFEWLSLKDSHAPLVLKRLVSHATIYCIWAERNKRLHDGTSSTPSTICKLIDRNIRDTILGETAQEELQDPYAIMVKEPLESLNSSSFNGLHLVFILFAKVNSILFKVFCKVYKPFSYLI